MRCSLLVLSSYLDSELESERAGELEAHLVACSRCSTALAYLREETEHIAALPTVRLDDRAAAEIFSLIGLPLDEGAHETASSWRPHVTPDAAPAWLGATGSGNEWQEPEDADTDWHEVQASSAGWQSMPPAEESEPVFDFSPPAIGVEEVPDEPPAPEPPAPASATPSWHDLDVPAAASAPAWDVPATSGALAEQPSSAVPAVTPDDGDDPMGPPPRVHQMSSLERTLGRARDAIAVRLALMRGPRREAEDAVQIVSGDGAPSWEGRPAHRGYQERMERRSRVPVPPIAAATAMPGEFSDSAAIVEDAPAEQATGHAMPPLRRNEMALAAAATSGLAASSVRSAPELQTEAAAARVPEAPAHTERGAAEDVPDDDDSNTSSTFIEPAITGATLGASAEALAAEADDDVPEPRAQIPGRHMRSLARGGEGASRFAGLDQLTSAVARRTGARRGRASGIASVDRRLWIFGAVTVLLLIAGLLTGKHTTPRSTAATTPGSHTQPSAAPTLNPVNSNPPTAAATLPPSPSATAAATPTPAASAPAVAAPALADLIKLGGNGSGYTVEDIRYGNHGPSDFRIVFDMSGGSSGTPPAEMGFTNPTTFWVELGGATASGAPETPHSSLVRNVALLTPSPAPGKIVYQFTLSKNVNFIANYLSGPRLVIDLT